MYQQIKLVMITTRLCLVIPLMMQSKATYMLLLLSMLFNNGLTKRRIRHSYHCPPRKCQILGETSYAATHYTYWLLLSMLPDNWLTKTIQPTMAIWATAHHAKAKCSMFPVTLLSNAYADYCWHFLDLLVILRNFPQHLYSQLRT